MSFLSITNNDPPSFDLYFPFQEEEQKEATVNPLKRKAEATLKQQDFTAPAQKKTFVARPTLSVKIPSPRAISPRAVLELGSPSPKIHNLLNLIAKTKEVGKAAKESGNQKLQAECLKKVHDLFNCAVKANEFDAILCELLFNTFACLGDFQGLKGTYQVAVSNERMTPQLFTQYILLARKLGGFNEAEAAFELACSENKIEARTYVAFHCVTRPDLPNDSIFNNFAKAIKSPLCDTELYAAGITLAKNLNDFSLAQCLFQQANKEGILDSTIYAPFIKIAGYTEHFLDAKKAFDESLSNNIESLDIYCSYLTVAVLWKNPEEQRRIIKLHNDFAERHTKA